MVTHQRASLAHVVDSGSPPADLFAALPKKWVSVAVEEEALTTSCSTCYALNLDSGALSETGRSTYDILRILIGKR